MSIRSVLENTFSRFFLGFKKLFTLSFSRKMPEEFGSEYSKKRFSKPSFYPQALMADKPKHHVESLPHYELVQDDAFVDTWFFKLRDELFAVLDKLRDKRSNPIAIKEFGWLELGRPYFYIKAFNKEGLLFEKDSTGWTISLAEKIVGESTFVRKAEAWDRVLLYAPRNRDAKNTKLHPRVVSDRLMGDRMHFQVYEQKLLPYLGL